MAFAGFVMALVTIKKGLKHVGLEMSSANGYLVAIAVAVVIAFIGKWLISRQTYSHSDDTELQRANVEKVFALLLVVTACCMAVAHGSNDVANAIGPLAAVVSVVSTGEITASSTLAPWILPLGGLGIVAGLALFGHRVIATIGEGITHLTPSRGFAAEMAAACTVVIASGTGLPISTTQTLVGAVLGVGLARGVSALNLGIIRNIVISWIVTLPAGAILSIACFFTLKAVFGA